MPPHRRSDVVLDSVRRLVRIGATANLLNLLQKQHPADLAQVFGELNESERKAAFSVLLERNVRLAMEALAELGAERAAALLADRSAEDIARWGMRVTVRSRDALLPVEERIRLRSLLEERRPVLGQSIVTDTGRTLGRCGDVQFETEFFTVERLWPRRFFRWGTPLPITQVIEVRKDAIVVRDTVLAEPEKEEAEAPLLVQPEAA